jgi:hypothetical protein
LDSSRTWISLLQEHDDLLHALARVEGLEELLLLFNPDAEVGGDDVGQHPGLSMERTRKLASEGICGERSMMLLRELAQLVAHLVEVAALHSGLLVHARPWRVRSPPSASTGLHECARGPG